MKTFDDILVCRRKITDKTLFMIDHEKISAAFTTITLRHILRVSYQKIIIINKQLQHIG